MLKAVATSKQDRSRKPGSDRTEEPERSLSSKGHSNIGLLKSGWTMSADSAWMQLHPSQLVHRQACGDKMEQTVSSSSDPLEQEADRVADQVMRMPAPADTCAAVQRKCAACPDEEEKLQRISPRPAAADANSQCDTGSATLVQDVLNSPGEPLDQTTRSFFEPRFGHDFRSVRIHSDTKATASARAINALAYTHGNNVVLGSGRQSSHIPQRQLLAHELAHVVQQRKGRPSIQRMAPCPAQLKEGDPIPPGWKKYPHSTKWFHCGFLTILEDRKPTPSDFMNECVYDHSGTLVDEHHPYAGCRGTPDEYDASESIPSALAHTFIDPGGIVRSGGPAFVTSALYPLLSAIGDAIKIAASGGRAATGVARSLGELFGNVIALGLYAALACVDPDNWTFQGVPARSIRHLNAMGLILGSSALTPNPNVLLQNLIRRLDSFPIPGLLDEISTDVNQALQSKGTAETTTPSGLGTMSLVTLVDWLRAKGLLAYQRPPEEIARERLAAETTQ